MKYDGEKYLSESRTYNLQFIERLSEISVRYDSVEYKGLTGGVLHYMDFNTEDMRNVGKAYSIKMVDGDMLEFCRPPFKAYHKPPNATTVQNRRFPVLRIGDLQYFGA